MEKAMKTLTKHDRIVTANRVRDYLLRYVMEQTFERQAEADRALTDAYTELRSLVNVERKKG
jgi:hypothetical protein